MSRLAGWIRWSAIALLVLPCACATPGVTPASKPPMTREQLTEAITPLIAKARATYPDAKRRFLAGLPQGQSFFVSVPLRDSAGRVEQAYVDVQTYQGHTILGRIASPLERAQGFVVGDPYEGPESGVMDWVISHPDGSEEGKFIGRYLDERL
jgi:hypothetical protein